MNGSTVLGLALLVLLGCLTPPAASAGVCDDANTTQAMIDCMHKQGVAAQEELAKLESKIAERLDPKVAAKFQAANEAWRQYRDKDCQVGMALSEGGTVAPLELLICRLTKTQKRIEELNSHFDLLLR